VSVFATQLKRFREDACVTQAELADDIGMSLATVVAYEVGRRRPTLGVLRYLTKALGLTTKEGFQLQDALVDPIAGADRTRPIFNHETGTLIQAGSEARQQLPVPQLPTTIPDKQRQPATAPIQRPAATQRSTVGVPTTAAEAAASIREQLSKCVVNHTTDEELHEKEA